MRRFILITILAIAYCFPFQAQNINVDKETLAAMEIAFQTNSLIESQHNQNLLKIRQIYKGAMLIYGVPMKTIIINEFII